MGAIDASKVTSVAVIKSAEILRVSDSTITLMNYHVMGAYYSALMHWLFTGEGDVPLEWCDVVSVKALQSAA